MVAYICSARCWLLILVKYSAAAAGARRHATLAHPPLLPKKTLVIIDLKKWKNGKMENCHNHALFPRGW
jgi:hypothetical protein